MLFRSFAGVLRASGDDGSSVESGSGGLTKEKTVGVREFATCCVSVFAVDVEAFIIFKTYDERCFCGIREARIVEWVYTVDRGRMRIFR